MYTDKSQRKCKEGRNVTKNEQGRHSVLAIPELVSVFLESGTKFSQENETFTVNFWFFLG